MAYRRTAIAQLAILGLLNACGGSPAVELVDASAALDLSVISVAAMDASAPDLGPTFTPEPLFSVSPVALDAFLAIVPLGHLKPPEHTFPAAHIYFYPPPGNVVDVVSPGAVIVTNIAALTLTAALPPTTDYQVSFLVSPEVEAFFDHVKTLSPALQKALDAALPDCHAQSVAGNPTMFCQYAVQWALAPGDLVGTAGDHSTSPTALDLGVLDSRVHLPWVNTTRDQSMNSPFGPTSQTCPLEYFPSDLKQALYARVGDENGQHPRTMAPRCGEIVEDIAGTARGRWFVPGTVMDYPEDAHLALATDYDHQSDREAFSVGTSMGPSGLGAGLYYFAPRDTGLVNRRFATVQSDGTTYCYENLESYPGQAYPTRFTIVLQMPDATTLLVEKQAAQFCDTGPWKLTSAATTFER